MIDDVLELLERCIAAQAAGADFPAIWKTILDGHRLVVGNPVTEPGQVLAVPLSTGHHILFARQFTLRPWLPAGASWISRQMQFGK